MPAASEQAPPRRGRSRRSPRRAPAEEALKAQPEPEKPAPQPEPVQAQAQRRRSSRGKGGNGSSPGSVEALIARQNVLFEDFAAQQTQAVREIQKSVSNISRGGTAVGGPAILPKVGVFLDVPNLIYAAEQAGVRVHFGKLLDFLTQGRQLVRATAYAPITDDPNTRFEAQRFVAPVINQGYKVVTKTWKRFADGGMKANFDIELAVDILTMSDRLDIVVLLSGDGDFRRVLELVESKGVRVEVVSFASSTAMELRAVADYYIDLGSILSLVGA